MTRITLTAMILACAVGTSAAYAGDAEIGSIEIDDAWARATTTGMANGAAYMKLDNEGKEFDRLVSAASPVAAKVELHTHTIDSQGVAQMRPVEAIELPADGEVELAPGGLHVMLMGLTNPLEAGSTIPLTLTFERAGSVTLDVPVKSVKDSMAGMKHDHGQQSTGQ